MKREIKNDFLEKYREELRERNLMYTKRELEKQIRSLYELPEGWEDKLSPSTQRVINEIFTGLVNYGISNEKNRVERDVDEILYKIISSIKKFGEKDFDRGYVISAVLAEPIINILERCESSIEEERKTWLQYLSKLAELAEGKIRIVASPSETYIPKYLRRYQKDEASKIREIKIEEDSHLAVFNEIKNKIFHYNKLDESIIALEIEIEGKGSVEEPLVTIKKGIYRKE